MSRPAVGGHRGFKRAYPENTILSFSKAIESGATIVETDLHITKDGVIIISHDPSTNRVFGEDFNVLKSNYDEIKHLVTVGEPHEPLITFESLLNWYIESLKTYDFKLMLDIKRSNPASVLAVIKEGLLKANPDIDFWTDKIIFGVWTLEFYKYGVTEGILENFEIINITVSERAAKAFIEYSLTLPPAYRLRAVSLMHIASWNPKFYKSFKKPWLDDHGIKLYFWTVNDPKVMSFADNLKVDAIITDSPDIAIDLFNEQRTDAESTQLIAGNVKYEFASIFTPTGRQELQQYWVYNVSEFIIFNGLAGVGIGKFNLGVLVYLSARSVGMF